MRTLPLWLTLVCGTALAKPAAVDRLAKDFLEAVQGPQADAAMAYCASAFRDRDRLSCRTLVEEVQRERIQLRLRRVSPDGSGAVVFLDATDSRGELFGVWLRAAKVDGAWLLIDGGDDDGPAPVPAVGASHKPPKARRRSSRRGDAVEAFELAINTHSADAIRALCGQVLRSSEKGGCDEIIREGTRGDIKLELSERQQGPHGEVATFKVVDIDGDELDVIHAYFGIEDRRPRLLGLDESGDHLRYFVEGKLPGDFRLSALQSTPELSAAANTLLITDERLTALRGAEGLHSAVLVAPSLGTGTICYETDRTSPTLASVHLEGETWVIDRVIERSSCSPEHEDFIRMK